MENKKILMGILLASIVMLSGCAVKEYFESFVVTEGDEAEFSLLSEKDDYVDEQAQPLGELIEDGDRLKITVEEDDTVVLMPEGEDADMDEIVYSFTSPLDEKGAWKTNYGDAGKYIVTVTASDGELTTAKEVLIEVLRKNVPPVITGIPDDLTIDEGDVIKVMPNITDPNGDEFTLDISDPIGNDGVWNTSYTDHDVYTVVITASDGELTTEKEMELTVRRKNIAPIIEPIADIVINEGETVTIDPVVTDLNLDDVTVTISDPVGDDGEWETDFTNHGEYTVTVTASDGELETVVDINLIVNDINVAPVILDITNVG